MELNTKYERKKCIKNLNFDVEYILKNIHKFYLGIAIFLGLVFSIAMPFFNEPDGQYHYSASTNLVGIPTDLSRYGELNISTGMDGQKESYKNGTRLEKYYLTPIQGVSKEKMPRNIELRVATYDFWGHVIPGVGAWIGYHIYPSLGIIITFARLFTMLVYSLGIYFIIKKLKGGRLLFTIVMLSPVVINTFSSLSYDSLGLFLSAAFIGLLINVLIDKKLNLRRFIWIFALILSLILGAKQNLWFLSLMFIPVFFVADGKIQYGIKNIFFRTWKRIKKKKTLTFLIIFLSVLLSLGIAVAMSQKYGGLVHVLRRYVMTFIYGYIGSPTQGNIVVTWLSTPYATFNHMPYWTTAVWYMIIILVSFSEKTFVESKTISYSALILFLLGIIATYYGFLNFGGGTSSYIQGVQGRYFTPTILLFAIFGAYKHSKFRVRGTKQILLLCCGVILLTNIMVVFNTLVGLIVG